MDEAAIRKRVRQILAAKSKILYQGNTMGVGGGESGGAYSGGKKMLGRKGKGQRKGGASSGGAWYDFLDPNKNGVANAFDPNKNGFNDAMGKVAHEFTDPDSVLRGQIIPGAEQAAKYAAMAAPLVGLGTSGGKRAQSARQKARGKLVASIMKKQGLTLPQASAYIKANNLF